MARNGAVAIAAAVPTAAPAMQKGQLSGKGLQSECYCAFAAESGAAANRPTNKAEIAARRIPTVHLPWISSGRITGEETGQLQCQKRAAFYKSAEPLRRAPAQRQPLQDAAGARLTEKSSHSDQLFPSYIERHSAAGAERAAGDPGAGNPLRCFVVRRAASLLR